MDGSVVLSADRGRNSGERSARVVVRFISSWTPQFSKKVVLLSGLPSYYLMLWASIPLYEWSMMNWI